MSAAGAIGPPAGAAGAVNWRSSVDLVGLGERLLYLSIRQIRQIRQIDGSLVQLVSVRRVSGREIDGKDPICAGLGSRAGRFEQRGGVLGSHVSLIKKRPALWRA